MSSDGYPVQIYLDRNFGGDTAKVKYGNYYNMQSVGFPDNAVSSMKIAPFTQVVAWDNPSYKPSGDKGQGQWSYSGPVEIAFLGDHSTRSNDMISSMQVRRVEPTDEVKVACCQGSSPAFQCGEFKPGSPLCDQSIANYCAIHMDLPACQSWCRSHTAVCDTSVLAFCKANPNHPYCTCINSPAQVKGAINPKCIDKKCLDSGYLTTTMQATACPNVVNCEVQNILNNSGVIFSHTVPVQQNCGNTTGTTPYIPPPVVPPQPQPTQPSVTISMPSVDKTSMMYVIIFIIIVLVAVLASYLLYEYYDDINAALTF